MFAPGPIPGLLGQAHLDPRRQGLLALAGSRDADGRAHADAWRRRRLRQRWRRHRREEEARERYREGLIGAFAAGDAEGLLPGAARGASAAGGFDLGNIGRGIGERAGDLGGGLLGVNNVLADELRRHLPPLGWFDADRGAYVAGRLPPERDATKAVAGYLKDLDLGYAPGTTWEEVKRSPAGKAIAFAVEQGLVSVPDMALALASLPAYVLARTGELAGARAEADLRKEATVGDLVAALPGAAASALLERLGARRILGIGDALGSRSLRGIAGAAGRGSAVEGGTETGQEGIEHLTSRLGTATGTDAREMADAMMAGGVAGSIFGGGVRGATATGQALLGRPQAREAGANAPAAPSVAPSPVRPEPRGTPATVSARGKGGDHIGLRRDPELGRMLDRALDPVRARADLRTRRDIGKTTPEQVEAIKAATRRDFGQEFDVTGFRHTVYEPELRKVWRKHGGSNETHPDGVPLTRGDFELIPEIVATGRVVSARPTRARQQPGVLYVKRIGDTYHVVEEVHRGRGELAFLTMYKVRPGGGSDRGDPSPTAPTFTSETHPGTAETSPK